MQQDREVQREREQSEAVEVKLQRWLSLLELACPEIERLAPGVGRDLLAPQGMDSCTELAGAINSSFWALVSGRATLQRHLQRAVRERSDQKRSHVSEITTLKAQQEAAVHTLTQAVGTERQKLELAAADAASEKQTLRAKLSFLETEAGTLRKGEATALRSVEQARAMTVAAYERSLAPLKSSLRVAKSELRAVAQRERLLVALAEKQREALIVTERVNGTEDYEELLDLNRQRTVVEGEIDELTQQLTSVPTARPFSPGGGGGETLDMVPEGELGDELLRARLEHASLQAASAQAELMMERERARGVEERLAQAEGAAAAAAQLRAGVQRGEVPAAAQQHLLSVQSPPGRSVWEQGFSDEDDDGEFSGSISSSLSESDGGSSDSLGDLHRCEHQQFSPYN